MIIIALIYVDDILIIGNNIGAINDFTRRLDKVFSQKDLGELHFLGIEVYRNSNGMVLTQKRYVDNLLKKFGMQNASSCPTPMTLGKHRVKLKEESLKDPFLYRSLVGRL